MEEVSTYNNYFNHLTSRAYELNENKGTKTELKALFLEAMNAMKKLHECASGTELTEEERRYLNYEILHFYDLMELVAQ